MGALLIAAAQEAPRSGEAGLSSTQLWLGASAVILAAIITAATAQWRLNRSLADARDRFDKQLAAAAERQSETLASERERHAATLRSARDIEDRAELRRVLDLAFEHLLDAMEGLSDLISTIRHRSREWPPAEVDAPTEFAIRAQLEASTNDGKFHRCVEIVMVDNFRLEARLPADNDIWRAHAAAMYTITGIDAPNLPADKEAIDGLDRAHLRAWNATRTFAAVARSYIGIDTSRG